MRARFWTTVILSVAFLEAISARHVIASEANLSFSFEGKTWNLSAADLLKRSDAADISVPKDPAYGQSMAYRAVPLLAVLGDKLGRDVDTIETSASDGFVSQIPAALIRKGAEGGSEPWIAIEPPDKPWPKLPGHDTSAGPFYLIWTNPEKSNVGQEQWPYALAAVTGVQDPLQRWPSLNVGVPRTSPAHRGQGVFIKNCMPCHQLNGAGVGQVGPDLGRPMNVTQYMSPRGIRAIIRNPKAVRTWPQQQMMGFDRSAISDAEIDALIIYLASFARAGR